MSLGYPASPLSKAEAGLLDDNLISTFHSTIQSHRPFGWARCARKLAVLGRTDMSVALTASAVSVYNHYI